MKNKNEICDEIFAIGKRAEILIELSERLRAEGGNNPRLARRYLVEMDQIQSRLGELRSNLGISRSDGMP